MSANYVYVISAGPCTHKIGISVHPEGRLASLQTGSPLRMKLVFSIETEHAANIEWRAHSILRPNRLEGEWFDVGATTAIRAVKQAMLDLENGCRSEPWPDEDNAPFKGGVATMREALANRAQNADFYRRVMLGGRSGSQAMKGKRNERDG